MPHALSSTRMKIEKEREKIDDDGGLSDNLLRAAVGLLRLMFAIVTRN